MFCLFWGFWGCIILNFFFVFVYFLLFCFSNVFSCFLLFVNLFCFVLFCFCFCFFVCLCFFLFFCCFFLFAFFCFCLLWGRGIWEGCLFVCLFVLFYFFLFVYLLLFFVLFILGFCLGFALFFPNFIICIQAPWSIAKEGHYSFPWIAPLTLDPYLIMQSVKQRSINYCL